MAERLKLGPSGRKLGLWGITLKGMFESQPSLSLLSFPEGSSFVVPHTPYHDVLPHHGLQNSGANQLTLKL